MNWRERRSPENRRAILAHVRELIAAGWTQHVSARDAEGIEVSPSDHRAVSFCAFGAIGRACEEAGVPSDQAAHDVLQAVETFGFHDVASYNDAPWRTKRGMLAAIDVAISLIPDA